MIGQEYSDDFKLPLADILEDLYKKNKFYICIVSG